MVILGKNNYTSFGLVGNLKKVDKTLKAEVTSSHGLSEASVAEKFVEYFESKGYELCDIFNCMDVNGDGMLTLKEIKDICARMEVMGEAQLQELVGLLDYNGDGSVTKD